MIDVHCHILPNIDDGPSTLTESIQMARQAARLGIKRIVATPHQRHGNYINDTSTITKAVTQLNEELQNENIPVRILPGQEVTIYADLIDDIKSGRILPLNEQTKYVMIELPQDEVQIINIDHIIYQIQMAGYIPIITSPETHPMMEDNPNLLYRMVKNGALAQVAAPSIVGANGKKVQKLAQKLINANLIHCIGSNAHNSTKRGSLLKEAIEQLKKIDTPKAFQLIHNNEVLVHGDDITKNEPYRITTKRWLFSKQPK
ncbi:tyrosine-protein phosphatase [Ornithinibacillus halotolerans]|uniref:Tyrosine-protein phosphatase n=1 Tax=Ornithinibacillus halotolerans TaxID=1274357 RepID=A0A916RPL8_9BACI|nr:CpsB/CapC family capsule biosynthesis tyrosine phosphatase [Ornithinibacillus halotolerans]GGA65074.1 tyrosine protein phosphatase [Ornithinibacillus halotolerans]